MLDIINLNPVLPPAGRIDSHDSTLGRDGGDGQNNITDARGEGTNHAEPNLCAETIGSPIEGQHILKIQRYRARHCILNKMQQYGAVLYVRIPTHWRWLQQERC